MLWGPGGESLTIIPASLSNRERRAGSTHPPKLTPTCTTTPQCARLCLLTLPGCTFGVFSLKTSPPSSPQRARGDGPTVCDQTADAVCHPGDSEGFANDKTTAVLNSPSHSLLLPQPRPGRAGPEPPPTLHVLGLLEHLSGDRDAPQDRVPLAGEGSSTGCCHQHEGHCWALCTVSPSRTHTPQFPSPQSLATSPHPQHPIPPASPLSSSIPSPALQYPPFLLHHPLSSSIPPASPAPTSPPAPRPRRPGPAPRTRGRRYREGAG